MKFSWVTINVKDLEESLFFYEKIVGLGINRRSKISSEMELVFLGEGDTQVELIYNEQIKDHSFGNEISIGFVTESLSDLIEVLEENNIKVESGPYQPNPGIKFLFVHDPNGVKVQFCEIL